MTRWKQIQKVFGFLVVLALLAGLFQWRTMQDANRLPAKSNFFVFWLSGKLILEHKNPYNAANWAEGYATYSIVQPNEPTFLYPLPLAVILTPIGFLPLKTAYLLWQWLSQIVITLIVYLLLRRWNTPAHTRLLVPMMFFLTFFGPVYLSLTTGSFGAITLLFIFGALILLDKKLPLPAGMLLALTMLKPPQGVLILFLLGSAFLIKREWHAILGMFIGGILLLLIGFIIDSQWISVFLQSSNAAFERRLGFHSNLWSFSYIACNKDFTCSTLLGAGGTLLLLGTSIFYLWKNHLQWGYWNVINLVIPIAFISTIYLWSYDQILFILPIVWIVGTFVEKRKSYLFAFIFLILLDLVSTFALSQLSQTEKDLWSLGTTLLVLLSLFIAQRMRQKPAIDKAPAPA